jgi:hypothetical protein
MTKQANLVLLAATQPALPVERLSAKHDNEILRETKKNTSFDNP